MLQQDKKVLKANLQKGALAIQSKLVFLYSHNLSSLSINSALIATLSVLGLLETTYPTGRIHDNFFGYMYYFLISLSIITAFSAHTLAAVEVIWGPLMALSGDEQEDVLGASSHMRKTQLEATAWECVAGVTLIMAVWTWIVANSGYIVGIPVTCVTFSFLYMMASEGYKAFNDFDLHRKWNDYSDLKEVEDEYDEYTESSNKMLASAGGGNKVRDSAWRERLRERKQVLLQRLHEVSGTGFVWTKSLHLQDRKRQTDCFHKGYMAVQDGQLNLFQSEKDFLENKRPCNREPIDLNDYSLETNPKIIEQHTQIHISASSTLRSALVGSQEVSFHEALVADFNVLYATKRLKFSLIPTKSSELLARDILHFMAQDEGMYKQWTAVLRTCIAIHREVDSICEQEVQITGTTVVQQAVTAANHFTAAHKL